LRSTLQYLPRMWKPLSPKALWHLRKSNVLALAARSREDVTVTDAFRLFSPPQPHWAKERARPLPALWAPQAGSRMLCPAGHGHPSAYARACVQLGCPRCAPDRSQAAGTALSVQACKAILASGAECASDRPKS